MTHLPELLKLEEVVVMTEVITEEQEVLLINIVIEIIVFIYYSEI